MIRAKHNIRHSGVTYKKGTIIDGLTKAEEERLVKLKSAEYVISPNEEIQQQQTQQTANVDPQLFEELRVALDELYNLDDLKRDAIDIGVNLTGVTRKPDVITAIINQGKANELLEDEENND